MKHNEHKSVQMSTDFNEWSKLDEEFHELCIKITSCFNNILLHCHFGKYSSEIPVGAAFFNKIIITTGSIVEYSASCRCLTSEKNEAELDQLICLGEIDRDVGSKVLISVKNYPGYFRLKTSSLEYIFPFFKDYQTFICLCPQAKDAKEILEEAADLFSLQNEYVIISKLRQFVTKVLQGGIQDPDNVTISRPASAAHRDIIQSIASLLKIYFPSIKIR